MNEVGVSDLLSYLVHNGGEGFFHIPPLIMRKGKRTKTKPASMKIAIPDVVYKSLNGKREECGYPLIFWVPKKTIEEALEFKKRKESPIIVPEDI
jgi:hypothetical protein